MIETLFEALKKLNISQMIRLISCGKLLHDESLSLRHFGITEANNVLHVQISNPPVVMTAQVQQQMVNILCNIAFISFRCLTTEEMVTMDITFCHH